MKIITKFMLTLAMLVVAVSGVKAGKLYADLTKLSNGPVSTWDGTTNTMTWTATSNNMISNFDFAAGNYRAYSTISITVSDLSNAAGIRLQIKANGQEKLVALNGNGTFTKYLTTDFGFTSSDLTKVEWIRVLGSAWQNGESNTINADNPASAVISEVYLNAPTRTKEVNLSNMAASEGNATWDSSTNTFAWTGTWSNAITLPGLSGNLSSFNTVNYETEAGSCDHFRILIYYSNGAGQTTYFASVGKKSVSFAEMGVAAVNLPHVTSIKISGANDTTGDITLKSFSLEGPLVNYIEETSTYVVPEGANNINGMTGAGNIKWNITYPQIIANETLWGGDIDSDNNSVDISNYDYLHFVVTDASSDAHTGLRVFVSDGTSRTVLYPHPIDDYASVTDWTATSWITAPGTYVVKISDYPLLRGFKALQSWAQNAGTITVSLAYVSSATPVAPTVSTVVAGLDALTDANATCFDVTGVPGTGISYNAANPNALFIANEGQLTNTTNVIVNGTCANLVLTDQKPFKTPSAFTATNAEFTKTVSDAGYATMVIPFDAALPEGVLAYNITGSDGDKLVKEDAESIEANKPVMLKNNGTFKFTATNAAIAATPDGVVANGLLCGVYNTTVVPAEGYVLQSQDNGVNFYKAGETGVEVNAFRAYLADATTTRLFFNLDDDVTGISEAAVSSEAADSEIYNLNGQRVANAQKGLYIVGGKKVMVK